MSELYRLGKVDTEELLSARVKACDLQQMQHGEQAQVCQSKLMALATGGPMLHLRCEFIKSTVVLKAQKDGQDHQLSGQ